MIVRLLEEMSQKCSIDIESPQMETLHSISGTTKTIRSGEWTLSGVYLNDIYEGGRVDSAFTARSRTFEKLIMEAYQIYRKVDDFYGGQKHGD